ncbi:hypothetical protein JOB18_049063 [Solea senegalensis]|uniref:Uncharacterized protein n=1 Tax=Solea senegalensis TaxID=28829 RepID=A0AAV6S145_SOLSE|nr:hypothetical protein JOB18_049063 [Solea senegalensis]
MISSEPDLRFPCRRSYEPDGNKITQTPGVLPQTGLKWAEMVLNKSCLSLVQKYLKRCSRDQAALLLPVPLNRKGRANFKKKNNNYNKLFTVYCIVHRDL